MTAVACALGAVVLLPAAGVAQGQATPDLVAQQIDIGQQWFRARCLECHEKGDLTNANFQLKWSGQSAFDLVDLIQRTMPDDAPGALTRGTYVAIVTYLMKLNGMPAGTAMLASDSAALRAVRLDFSRAAAQSPPH
jgi:mono/diheme cytochrome c family protein